MISKKEQEDIKKVVEIYKQLDSVGRLLIQNSANTLLTRDRLMEKKKKETELV